MCVLVEEEVATDEEGGGPVCKAGRAGASQTEMVREGQRWLSSLETAGRAASPARVTCPPQEGSLASISLFRLWLSHVALADTKWFRVESVRRRRETKDQTRKLGSWVRSHLCSRFSHLAL